MLCKSVRFRFISLLMVFVQAVIKFTLEASRFPLRNEKCRKSIQKGY